MGIYLNVNEFMNFFFLYISKKSSIDWSLFALVNLEEKKRIKNEDSIIMCKWIIKLRIHVYIYKLCSVFFLAFLGPITICADLEE